MGKKVKNDRIGQRVGWVRREIAQLNQERFAKVLGCSLPSLRNYEQGLTLVPTRVLLTMIEIYQVCSDWLLTGTGEPMRNIGYEVAPVFPSTDLEARAFAGHRLRTLRERIGSDPDQMDSLFNLVPGTWTNLEEDQQPLSNALAWQIGQRCGVSVRWLLQGRGPHGASAQAQKLVVDLAMWIEDCTRRSPAMVGWLETELAGIKRRAADILG